eukprot:scaffold558211_cov17-Prasinocladus_malaysianus.AAC.1
MYGINRHGWKSSYWLFQSFTIYKLGLLTSKHPSPKLDEKGDETMCSLQTMRSRFRLRTKTCIKIFGGMTQNKFNNDPVAGRGVAS